MIHFDSLIEKIKKKENVFNLKINQVLFSETRFSIHEKKDFLEKHLLLFRKNRDFKGIFFSLLALSEIYSDLKLSNLSLFGELEYLSKNDYYLRNYFFINYILILIEEGDVEGAKERAMGYLSFLDLNKLNDRIIYLVTELDKKLRLEEWLYSFWLKALGRVGDLEEFNKIYNRYKRNFLIDHSPLPSWYKSLQELWEEKGVNWWLYAETHLNKLILDLNRADEKKAILDCHNLLTSLHRYSVIFGVDGNSYRYCLNQIKSKYKDFGLDFTTIKKVNEEHSNDFKNCDGENLLLKTEVKISGFGNSSLNYFNKSIDLNREFDFGEKKLLGFLKKIPFDRLEKNLIDWLICFIQMKAFSILDYLIFTLETSNRFSTLNIKNKLEYEYLVCEIYSLKEDWEKLLIRSSNILKSYDLSESDYLPIFYLKGEALLKMGRFKEAKKVFLEIQGKGPSFRIVTQRLDDIGKDK